jgi:hypothetical protein
VYARRWGVICIVTGSGKRTMRVMQGVAAYCDMIRGQCERRCTQSASSEIPGSASVHRSQRQHSDPAVGVKVTSAKVSSMLWASVSPMKSTSSPSTFILVAFAYSRSAQGLQRVVPVKRRTSICDGGRSSLHCVHNKGSCGSGGESCVRGGRPAASQPSSLDAAADENILACDDDGR